MKVWRVIALSLWLCVAIASHAQNFSFETLTTRNGLSANEVSCIYEDAQHFLWIGTREGLNRFDGRRFETFKNDPDNKNSISGNSVVDILQDKHGIYWIATKDGGLTRYDPTAADDKQFTQFRNNPKDPNSIATNRLNCLYDWDENYLLIGAEVYPGIFINKKTFAFSYWNTNMAKFYPKVCLPHPANASNWIHHITGNTKGEVYVSTLLNGHTFKADKKTGVITVLHDNPADVLSVSYFVNDRDKLWLGAWNQGLFVQPDAYTATANKAAEINDLITCISNYSNDYLLAGTRASGLYLVNKPTGGFIEYHKNILQPHALPSNKINCLFLDSRGIVWIGTSAGLAKYDRKLWMFDEKEFTGPENDCTILHCHRFADSSLAVNTSKGMFLSDRTQQHFKQLNFTDRGIERIPDYIAEWDGDNYIMGSEVGFFKWKKGAEKIEELDVNMANTDRSSFYSNHVYQVKQILKDTLHGQPGLWMPVLGYGLAFYHFDNFKMDQYMYDKKLPSTIGSNLARRVVKDKNSNIWVSTASGLYKWDHTNAFEENRFTSFINEPGNKKSIPSNDVTDVWCSEDNHLWISTNGGGLAEYDGKNFTQYLPENPVSSRAFFGMHADTRKRIWIITRNGLEVFDRTAKKFFHVDVNDGNANTSISPNFSNEMNGWLSFTSGNRIFSFHPDSIEFKAALVFPKLFLTDMQVFGKSYVHELYGVAHLKAKERFVNFTVSALQFTSAQSVRFQYKLEGLDENWNYSDDGGINYTNLPWGKFKLLVRVTNPSGQFGGEQMLASFIIATPFYATWWFIMLCVIATALIVYAFYQYRISQLLALQKVRNKIARDLHDDIGSTLGSISFFSEAAKQQVQQQNNEGAEKMLLKIGDTSREMIENMSDIVWSVNPNNDTVKHLMDRMRVFADDLIASSEILLHYNYDKEVEHMKLSMEQRKNIFLIYKETVYNSVKYSGGKDLYIDIKKERGQLLLGISDNGRGFDVNNYKSKNGNGIKNMRYRAEEIGAAYNIASSSTGTITQLHI